MDEDDDGPRASEPFEYFEGFMMKLNPETREHGMGRAT